MNPYHSEYYFDYLKIPSKYYVHSNPNEVITLYKGGIAGLTRFQSNALRKGHSSRILEAKMIIERGEDSEISTLFERHTDGHDEGTPFLSATFNPLLAQYFAMTPTKTIYELQVLAKRCVLDYFNTGRCGKSKEILILGEITPEEISRVKINNEDRHSELLENGWIPLTVDTNELRIKGLRDPQNWARRSV